MRRARTGAERPRSGLAAEHPRAAGALAMSTLTVVVVLTLGPVPQPDFHGGLQPIPHMVAYATLTAILLSWTHPGGVGSRWWSLGLLAVALVALGAGLELAQGLVGRDAELHDVAADALGVAVGLSVWALARVVKGSRVGSGGT